MEADTEESEREAQNAAQIALRNDNEEESEDSEDNAAQLKLEMCKKNTLGSYC